MYDLVVVAVCQLDFWLLMLYRARAVRLDTIATPACSTALTKGVTITSSSNYLTN